MKKESKPDQFVCWTTPGLELITSNVGKLKDDEGPILAALHQPMRVRVELLYEDAAVLQLFTREDDVYSDAEVLSALNHVVSDAHIRHNFLVAVTGRTGSGKSHLVRWIFQQFNETENVKVVWVPRRDDAQMIVIKKFVDDLASFGSERAEVLRGKMAKTFNDVREKPDHVALAIYQRLILNLRIEPSLRSGQGDSENRGFLLGSSGSNIDRDSNETLSEMLTSVQNEELNDKFPKGIKKIIEEKVAILNRELKTDGEDTSPSNAATSFTPDYVRLLLRTYESHFRNEGVNKYFPLLTTAGTMVDTVSDIFNEALVQAFSSVMSLEGSDFKEIFSELRNEMAGLGKQLVIFMEDFSGIAGGSQGLSKLQRDLLTIFTEESGDDRAPLRVIFAITNTTYGSLEDNFLQRLTLRVDVDGVLDGVDPMPFVSRYLNIARTTKIEVISSWTAASDDQKMTTGWIPNKCNNCPFKTECHDQFGEHDGIGFYPFKKSVGKRIALSETPRERVEIISKILGFSRNQIPELKFPNLKLAQILKRDDSDLALANLEFAAGTPEEKDRQGRYIHFWNDGEEIKDWERKVFGFRDIGSRNGIIARPQPTPDEVKITEPLENEDFRRIELWRRSDEADARNALTSDLQVRVTKNLSNLIEVNLARELNGGDLPQFRKSIGLEFTSASLRIEGFDRQEVLATSLKPIFNIPRDPFGEDVLKGVLLLKSLESRNSNVFGISEGKQLEALCAVNTFINQTAEELLLVVRSTEADTGGIFDVTSLVLKFMSLIFDFSKSNSSTEIIKEWFNGSPSEISCDIAHLPKLGEIARRSRVLTQIMKQLTQISQDSKEDDSPKYRRLGQLAAAMESKPNSPVAILGLLKRMTSNDLEWRTILFEQINSLDLDLTDEKLMVLKEEVAKDLMDIDANVDAELESNLAKLSNRHAKMMNMGLSQTLPKDFDAALQKIRETVGSSSSNFSKVRTFAANWKDRDLFLLSAGQSDAAMRLAKSIRLIAKTMSDSISGLENRGTDGSPELEKEIPFDLRKLTKKEDVIDYRD